MNVLEDTLQATDEAVIYIVDDLAEDHGALRVLLGSQGLACTAFEHVEAFEAALDARASSSIQSPSCLLLDMCGSGPDGPALFARLVARGVHEAMPVIFLTAHGDLGVAAAMFRLGAFDFIEKPAPPQPLLRRVAEALAASAAHIEGQRSRVAFATWIDRLSERQRHIAGLMIRGLPNKVIARQLEISVRTVEANRARIFRRLRVGSALELAVHMSRFGPPEAGQGTHRTAAPQSH